MTYFKWWRRIQGGTWYHVRRPMLQDALTAWVREPFEGETIMETESYD